MSPRARKFTRVLSARITQTPIDDASANKETCVEVRRAKSLNTTSSSTLPRSTKQTDKKEMRWTKLETKHTINSMESETDTDKFTIGGGRRMKQLIKLGHIEKTTDARNVNDA